MGNLVHAVARVRALESELLTSTHVDRMISAPSLADSYAVLDDLGYAMEASRSREDLDFEYVLESGLYSSRKAFESFGIPSVFSVLAVLWDIQNIKRALKGLQAEESEEDVREGLVSYGSYSRYSIIKAVYHSEGSELVSLVQLAKDAESSAQMELIVEKEVLAAARNKAGDDAFLKEYIETIAQSEDIKQMLSETGDLERVQKSFPQARWAKVFTQGQKGFDESGTYELFETQIDIAILQFLVQTGRGEVDGYAPLFAFYWKKERNARVIRSILLAKRAGMSPEEIRKEFSPFQF